MRKMKFRFHVQLNGNIFFSIFGLPPRFVSRSWEKLVNNVLYPMVQMWFMYGVVGRVAPEAFFPIFQMGYDAVAFTSMYTARGRGEESRLPADEEVASGGVAGAELAGPVQQAGVRAEAVALAVVHGVAGGDKRRKDKQSA